MNAEQLTNVEKTLLAAVVILAAALTAWVVHLARTQRISPATMRALTVLSALGFLALLLSDWPLDFGGEFWSTNDVVAGVVSTVLLLGTTYLAYEESELRAQTRLDSSLTATGLGGIVDHVVDAEVGLSLLSAAGPPDTHGWEAWDDETPPLRWLREHREWLNRHTPDRRRDPRSRPPTLPAKGADAPWRLDLVDQCVRRLLAAIRDWAPVIGSSRNGVRVLIALSELRKDLMELSHLMTTAQIDAAESLLTSLRQRVRLLAYWLETMSGAEPLRPEVLTSFAPLPTSPITLEWASDPSGRDMFGLEWTRALTRAQQDLAQTSSSS